jgi:hypothetical protein
MRGSPVFEAVFPSDLGRSRGSLARFPNRPDHFVFPSENLHHEEHQENIKGTNERINLFVTFVCFVTFVSKALSDPLPGQLAGSRPRDAHGRKVDEPADHRGPTFRIRRLIRRPPGLPSPCQLCSLSRVRRSWGLDLKRRMRDDTSGLWRRALCVARSCGEVSCGARPMACGVRDSCQECHPRVQYPAGDADIHLGHPA